MQWPVIHVMFFSNSHMFPQRLCDLFKLDPQNPAAWNISQMSSDVITKHIQKATVLGL